MFHVGMGRLVRHRGEGRDESHDYRSTLLTTGFWLIVSGF